MKPLLRGYLHFLCWLFGHFSLPLSFALGSEYTGLSKDSVSGNFILSENPVTALRQHRIPLREGWEYVKEETQKWLIMSVAKRLPRFD